ncbi:hypothetical protein BDV97DRAFT_378986 [Delphinella strobiligena]|nr:hypothetical protein BDV97DRAFT_378986 [Delphinella strobiligena]
MDRAIPAFYACYLLRSTIRHQNLYVGSTPNPVRRLKQHNGLARGGAARTSRDSLRPWEMTCLVTGFPSKIAALQFEWAWQNTHLTRHIAAEERITQAHRRTRTSPKTGRTRTRTGRPRVSLTDKLSNLHILLRAKSFERWPLEIRFFAEDVFKFWERCTAKMPEKLRSSIKVGMHMPVINQGIAEEDEQASKGINALDVTFQPMKPMIEKSQILLAGSNSCCAVCHDPVDPAQSLLLVCVEERCESVSHLNCLSKHFLDVEQGPNAILPIEGRCPTCKTTLRWSDLVKDLSLRMRGEKEVVEMFRQRRSRKKASATLPTASVEPDEGTSEEEMEADEESDAGFDRPDLLVPLCLPNGKSQKPTRESDGWHDIDDVVTEGTPGCEHEGAPSRGARQSFLREPDSTRSEVVIEDSDWDEAEIIE